MDLSHKKLVRACRKNQYELSLCFMGGDSDEFYTGKVHSPEFSGVIKELFDLYAGHQLERASKGCSAADAEDLLMAAADAVISKYPAILAEVLAGEDPADDELKRDWAIEYLGDLGQGNWGGTWCCRTIYGVTLTHFDEVGDEYEVARVGR